MLKGKKKPVQENGGRGSCICTYGMAVASVRRGCLNKHRVRELAQLCGGSAFQAK